MKLLKIILTLVLLFLLNNPIFANESDDEDIVNSAAPFEDKRIENKKSKYKREKRKKRNCSRNSSRRGEKLYQKNFSLKKNINKKL